MSYERFVAGRHLRSNSQSFLSTITSIAVLGVFLGVMALTSVITVTGGFEEAFRDRVLGINSHIMVLKIGRDFQDYREVQQEVDKLPGVKATSPFIFHEMIATSGDKSVGVMIKGVEPDGLARVSDLTQYIRGGDGEQKIASISFDRFPDDGNKAAPRILIGSTLADKLKVDVGETLRVTSPLESVNPGRFSKTGSRKPSTNDFVIAGIYSSGFHDYDSRLVIADYRALQDFFQQGDGVTGLDVRVDDVFLVTSLGKEIERVVPPGRFRVLDWKKLNHNLFTSLGLQRLVLAVLFCFIVLVASFNIACTLIMMVLDRQKDIAILKSMGASSSSVLKIFIFQGMTIGLVGTLSGLIGGWLVCLGIKYTDVGLDPSIYMIDHLPVRIVPMEFVMVGVLAMFICLLATLGPSYWAARLSPVDGLRYE
jgi:lipoprotein-releasing system permease protein